MEMPAAAPEPRATDFVSTWRRVMQDPAGFFADMPETGGLGEPMRFLAIVAGIDAIGTLITCGVGCAIGAFVGLLVGAWVLAAVATLVTQQLFDGRAGIEPVLRVVAYGSAPAVVFWIPGIAAVGVLYAWYLHVRGIERVQGLDGARASLAMLLSWAALFVLARGVFGPLRHLGPH